MQSLSGTKLGTLTWLILSFVHTHHLRRIRWYCNQPAPRLRDQVDFRYPFVGKGGERRLKHRLHIAGGTRSLRIEEPDENRLLEV
jgi:hypothetical protein